MSKYSPVGNIHLLQSLNNRALLGNYLLLLAHHVAEFPDAHRHLLEGVEEDMTIILDNSLIELGAAADIGIIEKAMKVVNPDYIVLPDVLLDRQATIKAATEAYEPWLSLLEHSSMDTKFMAVIQGAGYDEMFICACEFMDYDSKHGKHIGALSIPRKFATVYGSRQSITRRIHRVFGLPMHMLGFSNNLIDDLKASALPGVMGIDSATPLRLGFEGTYLERDYSEKDCTIARETYFKDALEATPEMLYNIAYVRGALDGLYQQCNTCL